MTPAKSMTTFPTGAGRAAAAGRSVEAPTRGCVAAVEVMPLWARRSPAARAAEER
ncbi:hypothetical protein ACIQOW_28150 [Kitasatospora sp. NPDC091335]|uniref:hypothetical protein n=1 Tax=Kitasatospora sp. NPDC091335 TaxID=3364085 RepID=UPI0038102828